MTYQHLDLLIRHIEETHRSVTDNLLPLLEHGEITFELLWALFRPNQILFSECPGTEKPRAIKYDSGELITQLGVQKFRIEGRQLDYDGKLFGEVSIRPCIEKFHGRKRIVDLNVFPLEYHSDEKNVRAELVNCGRKFIQLMGAHHRQYHGCAFTYIKDDLVKFDVRGRIMVDAKFFHERNPNHYTPRINHSVHDLGSLFNYGVSCTKDAKVSIVESTNPSSLSEEDLLRCNATVRGFSFSNKMWCKFVSRQFPIRWR